MDTQRQNALVAIMLREFGGVKHVSEFRLAVALPGADEIEVILGRFEVGEENAANGVHRRGFGGQGDDAHVVLGMGCCGEEDWEEKFDEESVSEVVCSKLDFVAVFGEAGREGLRL
jgi:hypothetical protein